MISYRDMTFCTGGNPRCAAFDGCPRALTDDVKAGAGKWWNPTGDPKEQELMELVGPPIAQFREPEGLECYKLKEDK